jgi:diguanylate cyclase (GGDEF)-like protein/PAS domain S-box-containing protein
MTHRLLERQLRDLGWDTESLPTPIQGLAPVVSQTYAHLEEEIRLQAQALRLAADEMADQGRQLTEIQERLSRIIEFLPDPTVVIDIHGRVQAWNRAMEELTRVGSMEVLGKGEFCYAVPFYGRPRPILVDLVLDPQRSHRHYYAKIHDHGDALTAEVFAPALRQGTGAFLWARAVALRDASGQPIGAIEAVRDITDRQRDAVRSHILFQLARHTTTLAHLEALPAILHHVLAEHFRVWDFALQIHPPQGREVVFCQAKHPGFLQRAQRAMEQAQSLGHSTEAALLANGWLMAVPLPATQGISGALAVCLSQEGRLLCTGPGGILEQVAEQAALMASHGLLQENLTATQDKFQQLFDNAPLGILLVDPSGQAIAANAALLHLFGISNDAPATIFSAIVPPELESQHDHMLRRVLAGANVQAETIRRHHLGHDVAVTILGYPYLVGGAVAGAFFVYQDISERKRYEAELAHQALHDQLTGLPNRALFLERLRHALSRRQRHFAAMMLDLDDFKRVNDTLGHAAGDTLLQHVAKVLVQSVRSADTVARLGGDEFAILLEDITEPRETVPIIRRILKAMNEPVRLDDHIYQPATSIGVVLHTQDYTHPDEVLRDADIAMYHAKHAGKNRFKAFTRRMYSQVVQDMRLEAALRGAVDNGELTIHFQPIVQVADRRPVGFEGLVRWHHPELGIVSPATFVTLAEKADLIFPITVWMLEAGCRTFAAWRQHFPWMGSMFLSLNLSARDLAHPELVPQVLRALREARLPASSLKLEITETAIMRNIELASHKLHRLRGEGVGICMDDFGTGYSSLSYLRRLPVDTLKIDRSFVGSMEENPSNMEIVRIVLGLAGVLGMTAVAEGVETEGQLATLHGLGCPLAQGYLLGRPMDEDTLRTYLIRHAPQEA